MRNPLLLLSLGALALAACDSAGPADSGVGPTPALTTAGSPAASSADDAAERAALTELTRTVALALGSSPAVRNEVRRDLADSRYTVEHKLPLRAYLTAQAAAGEGKLLQAMAEATGRTTDEVLALADSVRALEFYLPVDEHRAQWRGGRDMIVASMLDDETGAPTGFELDGAPATLAADRAPATPVLSLVPVETDFSSPLPESFVNADDAGGAAVGTYTEMASAADGTAALSALVMEEPCEDPLTQLEPVDCGGTGGGTGGTSYPSGFYYTAANLNFVGEAWAKGDPEIEVWIRTSFYNEIYFQQTGELASGGSRCQAGEYADIFSGRRQFDQNDERWSGNALLLSEGELSRYTLEDRELGPGDTTFTVVLWEDDNGRCDIRTGITTIDAVAGVLGGGLLAAYGVEQVLEGNVGGGLAVFGVGMAGLSASAYNLVKTDDEFLGVAVDRSGVADVDPEDASYSHILITDEEDGAQNGGVNLMIRN